MQAPASSQAPYGFRCNGQRLVTNGEEALIRQAIFELFIEHQSKGAVARILNERGLRTRRGSKWSDVAVSRQLTCSSAKGIYAINKTTTDESGKRIERPREEWDFVLCDRIVPDELWDQVQAVLNNQKQSGPPSGKRPVHTFSGLLRCSCGGKMAVPSNSAKYVCAKCRNKIPCEDLEEIFRGQLSRLIADRPELFGAPLPADENLVNAEAQLASAQDDLRKAKIEMTNFERLYASGEISLERFGEVHAPLEKKRATLLEEIKTLGSNIHRLKQSSPSGEESDPEGSLGFHTLVDQWHSLLLDDRQAIVQSLVQQITIGDGEVEFAYNFPDTFEEFPKDATVSQQMESPTHGLSVDPNDPYYIRLPKPGERCSLTGLSRSKLNELILASDRNSYNPPVKSLSLKLAGRTRGTRLIVWPSLKAYLASLDEDR